MLTPQGRFRCSHSCILLPASRLIPIVNQLGNHKGLEASAPECTFILEFCAAKFSEPLADLKSCKRQIEFSCSLLAAIGCMIIAGVFKWPSAATRNAFSRAGFFTKLFREKR